jgi:hypothetical protein
MEINIIIDHWIKFSIIEFFSSVDSINKMDRGASDRDLLNLRYEKHIMDYLKKDGMLIQMLNFFRDCTIISRCFQRFILILQES